MCSERKTVGNKYNSIRKGESSKEVPCGFNLYFMLQVSTKNKPTI